MTILIIIISGLISTILMSLLFGAITHLKIANADMIRALGSIYTKKYNNSFKPGFIFMMFSGVLFAFIYYVIINFFVPTPGIATVLAGLAMGFFHGMVVSLGLVVLVAEHHPLEEFRAAGFAVAGSHLIGHIVYGFSIGTLFYFGSLF